MKEKTSPTMIALTLAVISILGLGGVTAEASAAENDEVRIAKIQIVNNQIIDAAAIDYADDYLRLDTDVQRITIADVTYELDMVTDAQLDFVVVDDLNTILDLDQIVDLNATVELDINPDIYDANLTALDFTDGINFEIKNVELMSNNIFDYTNVLPGRYIDRAAAIDQIEVDLELDDMGFVTIADQLSVDDITNNIPV